MSLSRIIEFSFYVLVAFLILATLSFFSLRPMLRQVRAEAAAEWVDFMGAIKKRNEMLPGLIEAIRGFESGHGQLIAKLLETRSILMRPTGADGVVAAVDEMERRLIQVEKLVSAGSGLGGYPPFARQWKRVLKITQKVNRLRSDYYRSVRLYNGLLEAFPQNLVATLFGFVPLTVYPRAHWAGEGDAW
jgi:LemA protein